MMPIILPHSQLCSMPLKMRIRLHSSLQASYISSSRRTYLVSYSHSLIPPILDLHDLSFLSALHNPTFPRPYLQISQSSACKQHYHFYPSTPHRSYRQILETNFPTPQTLAVVLNICSLPAEFETQHLSRTKPHKYQKTRHSHPQSVLFLPLSCPPTTGSRTFSDLVCLLPPPPQIVYTTGNNLPEPSGCTVRQWGRHPHLSGCPWKMLPM